jgi:hypothetical protein
MTSGKPQSQIVHTAAPPRNRRHLVLRLVLIVLVALVALVALAPTIVSFGVFRRYALSLASDRLSAGIAADSWSLSWLGSQEVRGLSIALPDGANVARADRVAVDQGLVSLWQHRDHPGTVRIEQAELWSQGLSRWITSLSAKPSAPPPTAPPPPPAAGKPPLLPSAIILDNVTVHAGADTVRISHARLADDPADERLAQFDAAGELLHAGARGSGSVKGTLEGLRADWRGAGALGASAQVAGEGLPLDVLSAMAADFGVPIEGGGTISVNAAVTRGRTGDFSAQGECQGKSVWVTGQVLQGDRPTFDSFRLAGKVTRAGDKFDVERLRFETAAVDTTANVTFSIPSAGGPPVGSGTANLRIDLAALARMLPKTISLQAGTAVDAGTLTAALAMESGGAKAPATLRLTADVTDLRGRRDGKPIALEPVHLVLDVLRALSPEPTAAAGAPKEPPLLQTLSFRKLELTGAFGSIKAAGRLEEFQLDAQLDLAVATEDLGRFVDLKGYGTAGTLAAHVTSQGSFADRIALATQANLKNVSVSLGEGRRWQEPQATLNAKGTLAFDAKRELTAVALDSFLFDGQTAYLATKGTLARTEGAWAADADVDANGEVARLASLANLALGAPAGGQAPEAAGWRNIVTNLTRAGAAARWGVVGKAKGSLAGSLKFAVRAELKDLQVPYGRGQRWVESHVSLDATGALAFDPQQNLTGATLDKFTFAGTGVQLAAGGSAAKAEGSWTYRGQPKLDADVPRLADLAGLMMDAAVAAPPARAVAAKDPGLVAQGFIPRAGMPTPIQNAGGASPRATTPSRETAPESAVTLAESIRQLAAAGQGKLHLDAQVEGDTAKFIDAKGLTFTVTDLAAPALAGITSKPLMAAEVRVSGPARYDYAGGGRLTTEGLAVAVPGFSGTVGAKDADLAKLGSGELQGSFRTKDVKVDLAALAETLAPFDLLPKDPAMAGTVDLQLTASGQPGKPVLATLTADGSQVRVTWSDGRSIREERIAATADLALTRDAAGKLTDINASKFRVDLPAQSLSGTAGTSPTPKGWNLHVEGAGGGDIDLLAQTVGRLLNREQRGLRGQWKVSGSYKRGADGSEDVDVAVAAANLAVPPSGRPVSAKQEAGVVLGDATLALSALVAADGSIQIRKADLAGPGVKANVAGAVRLPSETDKTLAANGSGTVSADLAKLAKLLEPFGVVPANTEFQGQADFTGNVTTTAGKVSGTGTLNVADLAVRLPEEKIAIEEPRVHLRATFVHDPRERRWDLATDGLESSLATGAARLSIILPPAAKPSPAAAATAPTAPPVPAAATAPAAPALPIRFDAACDLACDALRVRSLLGNRLPDKLKLAGPWKISGRTSGPLLSDGPWNQRLAALAGDGTITIDTLTYDKLTGGKGAVRWRLAAGQLLLSADPAQPSRLTVAGGTVTLGGRIDLRGPVARLLVTQPLRVVENVPLSDPGVRDYMKFTTPILAGSVGSDGRLSGDIESLDLPLADAEEKRGTGAARFVIDNFQTELTGPFATILGWVGQPTRTPVQRLGPIDVQLAGGYFIIKEHPVVFGPDTSILIKGQIGLDESLNIELNTPLTAPILKRFGFPAVAAPYLVGQRLTMAMTGTIHKPQIDDKLVAKRMSQMVAEALKRRALEEIGGWLKKGLK